MPAKESKTVFKITAEILNQIEEFGAFLFNEKHIYDYYEIDKEEWHKLCQKHPEIKKRLRKGRTETRRTAVSKLIEKINSGDTKSIIFLLETKFGYEKKQRVNFRDEGKPKQIDLKISTADPVEASRIYQQIMNSGS